MNEYTAGMWDQLKVRYSPSSPRSAYIVDVAVSGYFSLQKTLWLLRGWFSSHCDCMARIRDRFFPVSVANVSPHIFVSVY